MHNESKVISHTLESLKRSGVHPHDIYAVDDGSTDDTRQQVLASGIPFYNLLVLKPNVGKTMALVKGFEKFLLKNRYEWVNTLDADTLLPPDYHGKLVEFLNGVPKDVAAVCSRVAALKNKWNFWSAYRVLEYFISHQVYKRAQGKARMLTVLPGCGSTFRTGVFSVLSKNVDTKIITEDMDWTMRIYEENLGKILYEHSLRVITQDPDKAGMYTKQTNRWFRGAWQVYLKRRLWKPTTRIHGEITLLLLEGLFFSTLFLVSLLFGLFGLFPSYVKAFFIFDAVVFLGWAVIAAIVERDVRLLVYALPFYGIRILNCFIFLWSFIEIVFLRIDKKQPLSWNKVERY